ncbi:hypothetical protein GCM10007415_36930 [Parapedobacter pyrenivorans]|uniref:DUF4296 domain-containing protein n=1 Tax=Parapedobacter pyrenivorans TaxID=1305674 RepID=A0A917MDV0_9SPHI|nr:hypothetical protein GCM10007415_36930 [Parapedobacter pyrenivorans]
MRLALIGLVILFLVIACGEKLPKEVVPQQQMSALLLDMHLADGQLAAMPIDSARAHRDAYYAAIFNRYGIDSTTFEQSVTFYSTRPYMMNELYIAIEKKLEALNMAEQKAIEEKYAAQRRADSVINAKRTDSLRRIARDSLDFKRKRYLLYLHAPDSLYGKPDSVTYLTLRDRMLKAVGLSDVELGSIRPQIPNPMPPPQKPAPKVPDEPKPVLRPFQKIK